MTHDDINAKPAPKNNPCSFSPFFFFFCALTRNETEHFASFYVQTQKLSSTSHLYWHDDNTYPFLKPSLEIPSSHRSVSDTLCCFEPPQSHVPGGACSFPLVLPHSLAGEPGPPGPWTRAGQNLLLHFWTSLLLNLDISINPATRSLERRIYSCSITE